jgi:uncharacterized protein YkwD
MRITRQIQTALSAALLALLLTAGAPAATDATSQAQREASLVEVVNGVRSAHGLRPLAVDPTLRRVARRHSLTMLRRNDLAHGAFAARLAAVGARGPAFGENLAWGVGSQATARAIVRAWVASPSHRANLLRPGFRRIGIGSQIGDFAGHPGATVVTADFAGR